MKEYIDYEKDKENTEKETTDTKTIMKDKKEAENGGEDKPHSHEDQLELAGLSLKDRIKADIARQKEYMADMNRKEKISYFLYYYKWKIIGALILIICLIAIPVTIFRNTRPVALSYAIVNNSTVNKTDDTPIKEYLQYYSLNKGYQVHSSTNFYLNLKTYESNNLSENDRANYEQFFTLCLNGYFDIIISDKSGVDFSLKSNLLQPIDNIMPEDMLEEFNQKYPDKILGVSSDSSGYYIDISGTDFANGLNLSYNKVYLCFPGNKDEKSVNARRAIKFIFNLDYDIN